MESIFEEIRQERAYQDSRWGGTSFDDQHTAEDWQSWIAEYSQGTGRAEKRGFRERMLKTAALAVAAIQAFDRNT